MQSLIKTYIPVSLDCGIFLKIPSENLLDLSEIIQYVNPQIEKLVDDGFSLNNTFLHDGIPHAIWSSCEKGLWSAFMVMPSGELTWGHGETEEDAYKDLTRDIEPWL